MNNTASQPSLCIDFKKNRIRIHRHTLDLIGNPEYIQLLVNPTAGKIAIRRSNREDYLSHRIYRSSDECIELYSLFLMEGLLSVNRDLMLNRSYRLYGDIDTRSEMALFSMHEPVLISNE